MNTEPGEREEAPERLFVQVLRDGSVAAYERDPREVHDNGKPVYVYRLDDKDAGTTAMREAYVRELNKMRIEHESAGTYPQGLGIFTQIVKRLESLTLDGEKGETRELCIVHGCPRERTALPSTCDGRTNEYA